MLSQGQRIALLVSIFSTGLLVVVTLLRFAPEVLITDEKCKNFGVWTVITGGKDLAKTVWQCSEVYRQNNPVWSIATFSTLFITLQAFAISGPMVLAMAAGAMWTSLDAQTIVNLCSCAGMSLCYLLSSTIAKPLVEHYFSRRLTQLRAQLATWRGDTAGDDGRSASSSMSGSFFLILFLRMTPFVPNWFVSLSAPVVGFPYPAFLAASLLGIIPANYVHCATGRIIKELALQEQASSAAGGADSPSSSSGGTWASLERWGPYAALFALQFIALLPVLLQSRISRAVAARKSAAESSLPSSSSTLSTAPQAPLQGAAPTLAVGGSDSNDVERLPVVETAAAVGILSPHEAPAPPDQQQQQQQRQAGGGTLRGPGRPVPRRQSRSRSRGPAAPPPASPTASGGVGRLRRSLRSKTPEPRQPASQQRRQAHRA